MSIFGKLFKKEQDEKEIKDVKMEEEELVKFDHRNKVGIKADSYKNAVIAEGYNNPTTDYTFEQAFDSVFSRTPTTRNRRPKEKDIEQFKTDLIMYSADKLSPEIIIKKYGFGNRSFFTTNVIWGFYYYGFDFRTTRMRKVGTMPLWLRNKLK